MFAGSEILVVFTLIQASVQATSSTDRVIDELGDGGLIILHESNINKGIITNKNNLCIFYINPNN